MKKIKEKGGNGGVSSVAYASPLRPFSFFT